MKSNQSSVAGGVASGPQGGAGRPGGSGQPGGPGHPEAADGLGRSALGGPGGRRLPAAPRERKPALAALAVLLILGGALTSAYLVTASGQRVSAIRIAQPVAAGQRIPLGALEEVQVSATGADYYINWSERANVARTYAAVPLVPGALLTNRMVTRANDAAGGRVVIGLALKPGQFPSQGLQAGKRVSLYAVGGGPGDGGPRAGTVLSSDAIVVGISRGDRDSNRLRGDQTSVDVAVPPSEAPLVTQAASAGAIALALIPEGTRLPPAGGRPQAPPPPRDAPSQNPQDPQDPQDPQSPQDPQDPQQGQNPDQTPSGTDPDEPGTSQSPPPGGFPPGTGTGGN